MPKNRKFPSHERGIDIIEDTQAARDEFGHAYGSSVIELSKEEVAALLNGKQLATYDGEYVTFIRKAERVHRGWNEL